MKPLDATRMAGGFSDGKISISSYTHSMSRLEALYWARKYPAEVSAIIGLEMSVPEYYGSMNINIPAVRIAS